MLTLSLSNPGLVGRCKKIVVGQIIWKLKKALLMNSLRSHPSGLKLALLACILLFSVLECDAWARRRRRSYNGARVGLSTGKSCQGQGASCQLNIGATLTSAEEVINALEICDNEKVSLALALIKKACPDASFSSACPVIDTLQKAQKDILTICDYPKVDVLFETAIANEREYFSEQNADSTSLLNEIEDDEEELIELIKMV